MSYERWLGLNLDSMRAFYSRIAEGAPRARLIEREALIAVVNPATPRSSLFNSVIYTQPRAVERELASLAATYEEEGILAWTVWVPDLDDDVAQLLRRAGHHLDASPSMMGAELAAIDLAGHSMDDIDWTASGSGGDVARINDIAYGDPEGFFGHGCGPMPAEHFRNYVADYEGEPGACVSTTDAGSDLGIWAVATLPEARNRGLSTALMRQAIADARERGLETTTLQASELGRPVYEKVGYSAMGAFEMWERRREE